MKRRDSITLPGYLSVAGTADRLRLAPRSVRDLIYAGRLPSARLGRRHFLKISDVEAERRRRLGLPLPERRPSSRRRKVLAQHRHQRATSLATGGDLSAKTVSSARQPRSEARRERAAERAAQLERWLHSGNQPALPSLPFTTFDVGAQAVACGVCRRVVRPGGRMVEASATDGRSSARLCLTCARRAMLAWSDARRREATAARRLAEELGALAPLVPLLESANAA
jgi:hypothetical protein